MSRTVQCPKLGRLAEGLDRPPFPGAQGQRIFEQVSAQAWQDWLKLQTMLINEHRLTPFDAKDKQFLANEREKFLFGSGASVPEGYVPPKS
ncbi:MAG: oxidative damage protection protein [Candidatus Methylumidiphilus sp.]